MSAQGEAKMLDADGSGPPRVPWSTSTLNATRKPPPSPLTISTSLTPSTHLSPQNIRSSLDSSRSDLTSVRSELTSLRISEFPLPPSILPTVPASPATPKSLFFTTTPTSATVTLLQEPIDAVSRSRLPSPKALKGFFTRSNNNSQTKLVPELQPSQFESSEFGAGMPDHNSYSIYETAVSQPNGSRAPTPTTAGTMTPREWESEGGGRSSPFLTNNNALSGSGKSSPLPSQPSELEPRPSLSPPPQSPLPPPPSNRSSFRNSFRYSQILRQAGNPDLGMDITEEKLLSTDFITEMLGQPARSSSSDLPGISLQEAMIMEKGRPDKTGIQPTTPSGLAVINENGDLLSPSLSSPMDSSSFAENEVRVGRMNSVLASSVFPSGGDMIYYDSTIVSPTELSSGGSSSTLNVPSEHTQAHRPSHPFVPSTPMTPASFTSLDSPKSPSTRGISPSPSSSPTAASSGNGWSSVSQMVASRLPIGRTNSTISTVSTQRTVKSPKIRQHRYPKTNVKTTTNSPENVPMQELNGVSPMAVESINAADTVVHNEEHMVADEQPTYDVTEYYNMSEDAANDDRRRAIVSIGASAKSHATSTKTERDSIPVMPTVENLYDFTDGYSHKSSLFAPHSAHSGHSIRTRESAFDEADVYVGIAKTVDVTTELEPDIINRPTSPKIVGVAPARVVQPNRTGSPSAVASLKAFHMTDQNFRMEANSPVSPVSPRDPPSTRSPPSHRTDIPESAKSLVFSDEAEDVHTSHLPYETRSSGGTYWTMFPGIGNNPPVHESRSTKTNAAASFKSIVSYITSRSATRGSHKSAGNRSSKWAWLLRKPLPPLPVEAQDPGSSTNAYNPTPLLLPVSYEKSKSSPPVPGVPHGWDDMGAEKQLGARAGLMGKVFGEDSLKIAKRKPNRKKTDPLPEGDITPFVLPHLSGMHRRQSSRSVHSPPNHKKRKAFLAATFIGFIVIVIIIVLAVLLGRKQRSTSEACSGANVGTFCNLDATCICPSGQSGICTAPLAKALNEIVPQASQIFDVNITANALAVILWEQNGTPVNSDCSAQAELLDLGQAISPLSTPNRTSWAQFALIWTLFETASVNSTKQLQSQIMKLPFDDLAADGVTADPIGRFTVSSPGYILDFANQTVSPSPTKFVNDVAPSAQQLSEINPSVEAVLDRMYSFAIASSTQTQTALTQFWQNVLSLDTVKLPNFLSTLRDSVILLPFDVTTSLGNDSISDFLVNQVNKSVSFPPPIACYPGLSNSQLSSINFVETRAFGLPTLATVASTLDSNCFINRPVYGVLDVWRMRLPFPDGRQGVALQAAVLNNSGPSVRTILHAGELLSALPGPNETEIHSFNVNPREFGTLTHINHVALQWLQSFPSVDLAIAAAEYLSQSPTSPPPQSSPLLNATIPIIEVALFGEVLLDSDISSFVSSFSTPTGELFFGSSQGEAFRRWALQPSSPSTITWTSSAIAQQVVVETQTVDPKFESVWTASGRLIASGPTNSSSVQRVLNTLGALGLLST